jgi:HEAT repeat protein
LPDSERIRRTLLTGSPAHEQPAAKRQLNALTQAGGASLAGLTAILADPAHPDDLRITAARLLGVLNRPAALAPLLAATHDPNPDVRWQSILSLGLLRDPRALPPLIDLLAAEARDAIQHIRQGW